MQIFVLEPLIPPQIRRVAMSWGLEVYALTSSRSTKAGAVLQVVMKREQMFYSCTCMTRLTICARADRSIASVIRDMRPVQV